VRLLPALVDKVIFVVKWGGPSTEVAQKAVDLLFNHSSDGKGGREKVTGVVVQAEL
jgi:hypothetical protein